MYSVLWNWLSWKIIVVFNSPTRPKKDTTTNFRECVHGSVYRGRSTEPFCQGCWYGDSLETILESTGMQDSWLLVVLQSQALPSFFPVYGIGWWEARPGLIGRNGCLEHYQTKTGSSPFWRMELVHYSWVNFCAGQLSSFGTVHTESTEYRHHNTHTARRKKSIHAELSLEDWSWLDSR